MARKFGKKTEISLNPLDYSIYLMGEGGIGKTTLVKQVCEKMVGDKLREITDKDDKQLVLWVGSKRLIKRKALEKYIDQSYSI